MIILRQRYFSKIDDDIRKSEEFEEKKRKAMGKGALRGAAIGGGALGGLGLAEELVRNNGFKTAAKNTAYSTLIGAGVGAAIGAHREKKRMRKLAKKAEENKD